MLILGIMNSIRNMNNSAFRMMSANSSMMGLLSSAGKTTDLAALHRAENSLLLDKLSSQSSYKMSEAQLKALKKLEKDNIKRSFSTFA